MISWQVFLVNSNVEDRKVTLDGPRGHQLCKSFKDWSLDKSRRLCCGGNCKFTKPRFAVRTKRQHLEMPHPMHTEDERFVGHQIRSEGVDCELKELKAAVTGLDDAQ